MRAGRACGRERPGHEAAGRPASPDHAWLPLRQGREIFRTRISPGSAALPDAPAGREGRRTIGRISWDEALDNRRTAQDIVRDAGPEAILPYSYAGTMGLLNGSGMDRRFFHRLGAASRLDRTICSSAGGAALSLSQGVKLGTEPEQFAKSEVDSGVGRERSRHECPSVAVDRGSAAKRR